MLEHNPTNFIAAISISIVNYIIKFDQFKLTCANNNNQKMFTTIHKFITP